MTTRAAGPGVGPVPKESASRCALQSQLRGDPMLGTAAPAPRLLLVEQPGPWGPRALLDGRDDRRVAELVDERAAAAGLRTQAIRLPGRHASDRGVREVMVADTQSRQVHRWEVSGLVELLTQLETSTGPEASDPGAAYRAFLARPADAVVDTDPLYLVCTHGRHDACCALRGRPLVRALHELRPGRVWETTHVGGDRFAANLVVLPTGEVYGRVLPFAAGDLIDRVERGEVVPGLMRGRMGLVPLAQAGLIYAHEQLAVVDREAIRVRTVVRDSESAARVVLDTPDGPVEVELAMSTSDPARLTCHGIGQARARVYRGVRIRPWHEG